MRTILVLMMAVLLGRVLAQEKSGAGDTLSQKLSPGQASAKLQFLVGNFATETTMPASPASAKSTGTGTSTIAWSLDSAFLSIEEQSVNSMFGQYKGHGMLGYDRNAGTFVLSMFNNFGDHPTYKGNFVGDSLVLLTTVPMPKHPFDQKLVWYSEGEKVRMKVLNDKGTGFALVIDQTYVPAARQGKK